LVSRRKIDCLLHFLVGPLTEERKRKGKRERRDRESFNMLPRYLSYLSRKVVEEGVTSI
jgi:hypothetical protein